MSHDLSQKKSAGGWFVRPSPKKHLAKIGLLCFEGASSRFWDVFSKETKSKPPFWRGSLAFSALGVGIGQITHQSPKTLQGK